MEVRKLFWVWSVFSIFYGVEFLKRSCGEVVLRVVVIGCFGFVVFMWDSGEEGARRMSLLRDVGLVGRLLF